MDRDQAIALLEEQHTFPGPFEFRVVVRPPRAGETVSAMAAAAGEGSRVEAITERLSRKGTYVALHVRMHMSRAASVLDVYAILRELDHVLTSM